MYHTTTRITADKVFADGHLKGRAAFNVHDGALRSRGAPEVVFCSIEDEHPVVSPFPGECDSVLCARIWGARAEGVVSDSVLTI